jgi:hypothetical protein
MVFMQVARDIPTAEKLSQEADDIEENMALEFASRSSQARELRLLTIALSLPHATSYRHIQPRLRKAGGDG